MRAPLQIYAGRDPRDLPAYSIREAAHYLHLPESTLRTWVRGRVHPTPLGAHRSPPVIRLPDPARPSLSFVNLVEAHVLASVRRQHGVSLEAVRSAIDHAEQRLGVDRPLARVDFETDGVELFVEQMGHLVIASREGQIALRALLRDHLRRIERDEEGLAARLFPFTRPEGGPQPRLVVIDPRLSFGRPVIAGTGIPTAILAERYRAGESIQELAADYRCETNQVEEAIRCELRDAA